MNKLFFKVMAASCCFAFANQASHAAEAVPTSVDMDIASYPINTASGGQPLIMLMLGRDHSMYYEAYNDLTDLDEDGGVDGVFTPHVVYDGIFESNWCYTYDSDAGMFRMSSLASDSVSYNGHKVYKCDGSHWSGNFLNYVTSSRMDIVKRILIGGQRFPNLPQCAGYNVNSTQTLGGQTNDGAKQYQTCRDASGFPILARQYIPHDTHGWAKSYHMDDINARCKKFKYSCRLDFWAPVGGDTSAMFGSVGRQLLVVTAKNIDDANLEYDKKKMSLGSYKCLADGSCNDRTSIFVWNWVARESAAEGAKNPSTEAKGPLSFWDGKTALNKPGNTGNSNHFTVSAKEYNVVVQACNYEIDENASIPERCKNYGTESKKLFNTTGLLQDFSQEGAVDAYFGLITAIWNTEKRKDARKQGALRAPISDLSSSTQIDSNTGDFKSGSVYALIDILTLSSKEGTPNSTAGGNTSTAWSDCKINSNNDVTTPERGCSDWGNPLAPLIQKSYEYFNNVNSTDGGNDALAVKRFTNDQSSVSISYSRLATGGESTATPYKTFDYCYTPINFILADENISMDYDLGLTNVKQDNINEGFEYISEREGAAFIGNHIFGEYTGDKTMKTGETLHTLKNVPDLANINNVRGVSTLEPNLQGSLKGAALAAYLHSHQLDHNALNGIENGQTRKVPGFEHFAVAMASYLPQFEVYNKNGKKVLIVPTCKAPRMPDDWKATKATVDETIGSFSYDPEDKYTSNCAIADVFYVDSDYTEINGVNRLTSLEFRVTYEDNEAGSDFDMDALFTYKIKADDKDPNLVDVSITGFYHDTYAGQIGGYSIFGTAGVITPNYSNCKSSNTCSIANEGGTGYIVDNRSYYLDMMKVNQNSANFTLMRSFSDPYNEFNNVEGLEEGVTLAAGDSKLSSSRKVNVVSEGAQDSNHKDNCVEDSRINAIVGKVFRHPKDPSGNYVKYLPSFSAKCISTVSRKFYVTGFDENSGFYDSPLAYAAYYGSKYGNSGTRASRLKSNPNYFYVTNASKLASQITTALTNAVGSGGNSGTGLSFPVLDISKDSSVVTATYETTYWTGNLHRDKLVEDPNTGGLIISKSTNGGDGDGSSWTTPKFDVAKSKILIADKSGNLSELTADLLVDPSTSSEYPLAEAIVTQLGMGACGASERENLIAKYVDYIRGDASWHYPGDEANMDNAAFEAKLSCNGVPFYGFHKRYEGEDRQRTFGAIINSTPQHYSIGDKKKIIFASNDGMVHIVDSNTGLVDYSIIPFVSQDTMPKYAKAGNLDHYINDGVMSVITYKELEEAGTTTDADGNVKVNYNVKTSSFAIGSLGATHPGVYAIDLTHSASSDPKIKMLWELSANYGKAETDAGAEGTDGGKDKKDYKVRNFANLGAIKTKISAAPYKDYDGKYYLYAVFGNGYNSVSGKAGIVVVDAISGVVVSKENIKSDGGLIVNANGWSDPDCNRDSTGNYYAGYKDSSGLCFKNGMNEVSLVDFNYDGLLDYVYATDIYGNVYRINGMNDGVKDWKLVHIHTTVSPDYKVQPITTAPVIGKDVNGYPLVTVATGKYLGVSDLTNGDIQSIWALSDTKYKNTATASSEVGADPYDDNNSALLCNSDPTDMSCYRKVGIGGLFKFTMVLDESIGEELAKGNLRNFASTGTTGTYDADIHKGWVVDLDTRNKNNAKDIASERIRSKMSIVDNHLYVITVVPSSSECDGGGTSHWYDLNINAGKFYYDAVTSQTYSPDMYTEMNVGYSKLNQGLVPGDGTPSKENESRDRGNSIFGCSTVVLPIGKVNASGEIKVGPQYCPRIESWQYIYH